MTATPERPTRKAIDLWLMEVTRARTELDEARGKGLTNDAEAVERAWKRYYRILMAQGGQLRL